MKHYPPFQVITAGNEEPVSEPLNKAVYALLLTYGLDFLPSGLGGIEKDARLFTNTSEGDKHASKYLMYSCYTKRTDIQTFDSRTEFGRLVEFLENPPKPTPTFRPWTAEEVPLLEIVYAKVGACKGAIVGCDDEYVRVSGNLYTHKGMLETWTLADGTPCGTEVK